MEPHVDEVADDDGAWMLQAQCRGVDPETFFPTESAGVNAAQRLCGGCPVQRECLDYALRHRIRQGIWGGTSERERRRILRRQGRAVPDESNVIEPERQLDNA